MIIYKNPIQIWLDYIISVLMIIVTSVAGVLVNAYFYEEDKSAWRKVLMILLALIFSVLFLMAIVYELGGGEEWIEELAKLVEL